MRSKLQKTFENLAFSWEQFKHAQRVRKARYEVDRLPNWIRKDLGLDHQLVELERKEPKRGEINIRKFPIFLSFMLSKRNGP